MRLPWRAGLLISMILATSRPAWADPQAGAWALDQLKTSAVVNFDNHCMAEHSVTPGLATQTGPAPQNKDTQNWILPCRTITAQQFLAILSTGASNITLKGVNLVPDADTSRIDLSQRDFKTRLMILYSRIGSRFYLDNLHLISLEIDNVDIWGALNAEDLNTDDFVKLDNIYFEDAIDLANSKIGSDLTLSALYCGKCSLEGHDLHAGGNVYIWDRLDVRQVDFSNAIVDRSFRFEGTDASDGTMGNPDKSIICSSCSIAGDLDFTSRPVARIPRAFFGGLVNFSNSHIAGTVSLSDAVFYGKLQLDNAWIGNMNIGPGTAINTLSVRNTALAGSMLTQTTGSADAIQLGAVYLNGSTIARELDLSGLAPGTWKFLVNAAGVRRHPTLDLTNTSVGSFTDCQNSWPQHVRIDSFSYEKIYHPYGNSACVSLFDDGQGGNEQTDTGWIKWLGQYDQSQTLDQKHPFNPQPYLFMANFFAAAGQDGWSNDILYRLKEIQMDEAASSAQWANWTWLSGFDLLAGFEIWQPGFLHILVVIGVSILVGTIVLSESPKARAHSLGWRVGACFEQLLPLVQLSKAFRDFFDEDDTDPKHPNLYRWQKAFFAMYSLWGWLIGYLFLAMLSGVTKGS